MKEEAAARSAARFLLDYAYGLRHTEAVADCPHCNVSYLADWVLRTLGPEPPRKPIPGPPDPPRRQVSR